VLHDFLDGVVDGVEGGLVEDGEDVFDVFTAGDGEGGAHEFFGHGVEEGDIAASVGGDDGVAEAGEGGTEPLFALLELAGVDFALGHGLGDEVGEKEEAGGGDEGGEIDGDNGIADAAAGGGGAGSGEGGLAEFNFGDEISDLVHDEAAAIGENLVACSVGVTGLREADGVGELGELGLGEAAELEDLSLLRGIAAGQLLEEVKLGIELCDGEIVRVKVLGFAGIEIAALPGLRVLDEGLGLVDGDEHLLGVLHVGLVADEVGQLTPGNEGVGDQQDQEEYEAGDNTEALVNELHG